MTPERLRELYGETAPMAASKAITSFDGHCREYIENASFVVLATSNGSNLDISPKGDPAGFVKVETDNHLLIPDRPGNRRLDSLMNILSHPNVALLFMIPAVAETLRVNGTAEILDTPEVCDRFKIKGRSPKTVLKVTAHEIFAYCGKAPIRAGLWNPDSWPPSRPVSTLFEMIRDHTALPIEAVDQGTVEDSYSRTLY